MEWKSFFIFVIAREDDFFSGRMEERRPVCAAQMRYLFQVASVGITNEDFHFVWLNHVVCKQLFVFFNSFFGFGMITTENDFTSVRRKECAAIITYFIGDLFYIRTVNVHSK